MRAGKWLTFTGPFCCFDSHCWQQRLCILAALGRLIGAAAHYAIHELYGFVELRGEYVCVDVCRDTELRMTEDVPDHREVYPLGLEDGRARVA